MRLHSSTLLLCLCALGVLLTSCSEQQVFPPLPEGEQTVKGILQPASLSAVRRGTHVVLQDGIDVYYAESALVNLRTYQGKMITMRGKLEHNIDPSFLPVLVISSVTDVEDTAKTVSLPDIPLSMEVPVLWKRSETAGRYEFRLESDTPEVDPVLAVWKEEGATLPEGGVPIVIDASRAVRLIDDLSGTQIVAVKQPATVLFFRFIPGDRVQADTLREQFLSVLSTVTLKASGASSSAVPATGSGSLGGPCGGPAGILCPSGSYCDVTDLQENIGRCRRM
ncbi:hypothetical protein FJZ28_04225 [Candidatus Peregrinibacteria bacterium]|nr:hypothetical protein [Candidatus Peregrinibacteria bacterium]